MRRFLIRRLMAVTLATAALPVLLPLVSSDALAATVGEAAPAFELADTRSKAVKLSDYKGRHVVLEWTNPGCPFVQKHYRAQNMQSLQKEYGAKNVVWFSVSSTSKSAADYLQPAALDARLVKEWGGVPAAC